MTITFFGASSIVSCLILLQVLCFCALQLHTLLSRELVIDIQMFVDLAGMRSFLLEEIHSKTRSGIYKLSCSLS